MRTPSIVLFFLWMCSCGWTSLLGAQTPSSELARQHLESGIQFYKQGQYRQALNDFQIIVNSMTDSGYADDALLHIGRYYLEVDANYVRARETFDEILQKYPTEDAAPGAYYYLGQTTLVSSRGGEGLEDALANFQRVFIYRHNPWIPAALFSSGAALERQGKLQEAVDAYYRVIAEHPSSEWAAAAQLAVGWSLVRLGKPLEGMIELQRARNEYPESSQAQEALDGLTLLFRLYAYPELGQPTVFRVDPAFRPRVGEDFKDVRAVRVAPDGIRVLDRGRKRLHSFDWTGERLGTQSPVDPEGLFVGPRGVSVVANKKGLLVDNSPLVLSVPTDQGPKQLQDIKAAARDRLGLLYVYDGKEKKVLRFEENGTFIGPFPDSVSGEIRRIEVDPLGNVVLLDDREREVRIYSPAGEPVGRIPRRAPPWGELEEPSDIALDPAGFLYVLDRDTARVLVFDPSYDFLMILTSSNLGGGVLREPVTLDVDASGDLYVYDNKEKTVVRLY